MLAMGLRAPNEDVARFPILQLLPPCHSVGRPWLLGYQCPGSLFQPLLCALLTALSPHFHPSTQNCTRHGTVLVVPHIPTCSTFTDTAMALSLTLLNALIDLVSFSGILYSIYPPLFAALLIYSLGGTAASVALGKVGQGGPTHATSPLDSGKTK